MRAQSKIGIRAHRLLVIFAIGAAMFSPTLLFSCSNLEMEILDATTPWLARDGIESRQIELPNGITIYQTRKNGKISTDGHDASGLGAVLCTWEIYNGIKQAIEICSFDDDGWSKEISIAIDKIHQFVIANSLTKTSKQELDVKFANKMDVRSKFISANRSERLGSFCQTTGEFFQALKKGGRSRFQASIDRQLSVPRVPVSDPCL